MTLYTPSLTPELARQRAAHKRRVARMQPKRIPETAVEMIAAVTDEAKDLADPAPTPEKSSYRFWFAMVVTGRSTPTLADIRRVVSEYYGVSIIDMISVRREAKIVRPRQVAMYLSKILTSHSMPMIGRMYGDRDHTTVHHAVRKIERAIKTDSGLSADVSKITDTLEGCYEPLPEDRDDESLTRRHEATLGAPHDNSAQPRLVGREAT